MPVFGFAAALILAADSTHLVKIPLAPAESIAVTASGTGSPVVLIPGLFGSAYGFRQVGGRLRDAGYRVIVVEPLGIGWSSRPSQADYSLDAQTRRVAAVLDSLQVRDAIVVAHSIGAGVAFRLAYRRTDLVAGLVSLDGGPREAAVTPGLRSALKYATLIRLFGGTGIVRKKVKEGLIQDAYDAAWVTDSLVLGYTAGAARDLGATLRAFQGMARSVEPEPFAPHLAEIHCPVILLTGAAPRPNRITLEEKQVLVERIPGIRIEEVDQSGQYLQEERPDAVVAAIRSIRLQVASRPF
jgi:pimeloyl-ACP methyl ester carboxylesterase